MMIRDRVKGSVFAAILACVSACSPVHAQPALEPADDLARAAGEARERHVPVLVVFTHAGCPYCAKVKGRYLIPMRSNAAWREKVIMREADVDSTAPLHDFANRVATPRDFARQHNVKLVPTVMLFNDRGERLGEPLVGLTSEDFYGLYLERLIESGWETMQRGN